jgi:uncharacterized protein involved in exopolysaccharide biosynthesis
MSDKAAPIVSTYSAPGLETEQVELADYVNILWRRRWFIALGVLLCGVTAFGMSLVLPPVYQASARVLINPSKMVDQPPALAAGQGATLVGTFQALLVNRALVAQVLGEVGLDKPPHNLTAQKFINDSLAIDELPRTNLLRINVKANDPKIAAQAANRLALDGIIFNRTMNQAETTYVRDLIKQQLDEAHQKLEALNVRLLTYKERHQVELRRTDADSMLKERGELVSLNVDIESERARLARAEQELGKRDRTLPARRFGDVSGGLIAAEQARPAGTRPDQAGHNDSGTPALDRARSGAPNPAAPRKPDTPAAQSREDQSLIGALDLRNEFINPVYEVLEYQMVTSRTRLAALEARRQELVSKLQFNAGAMQSLTDLYRTEDELARLELGRDLAKTSYAELSKRYEQARLQVASRTAELQLIDPAVPPEDRIAPRPLRNTALAMAAGLLALIVIVFLGEYFAEAPVALRPQPRYPR